MDRASVPGHKRVTMADQGHKRASAACGTGTRGSGRRPGHGTGKEPAGAHGPKEPRHEGRGTVGGHLSLRKLMNALGDVGDQLVAKLLLEARLAHTLAHGQPTVRAVVVGLDAVTVVQGRRRAINRPPRPPRQPGLAERLVLGRSAISHRQERLRQGAAGTT